MAQTLGTVGYRDEVPTQLNRAENWTCILEDATRQLCGAVLR